MFPLWWQPFSQHKHWHGDSHLLVGGFTLFSQLARLISLGFHHRASAESASKLWKWLPWQAPGILSIWGWWVHLIYCGPVQKSSFHRSTPQLAVAAPWLWISCATHLLSNLHLTFISVSPSLSLSLAFHSSTQLSLHSLFLLSPPSIQLSSSSSSAPSDSLSLRLSPVQSAFLALLGWIRPLQPQPLFWYHFSAFHSLFIPFLLFSTHLSVYMPALSPFCQLIPVIYSIKCDCIPSVAAFLFYSPMSLCFSSLLSLSPPSILSQMSDKATE